MINDDLGIVFTLYENGSRNLNEKRKRKADIDEIKEHLTLMTRDCLERYQLDSSDLIPHIVRTIALSMTNGKNAFIERMRVFAHICEEELLNTPYECSFEDYEFPDPSVNVDEREDRITFIESFLAWKELQDDMPNSTIYYSKNFYSLFDTEEESPKHFTGKHLRQYLSHMLWTNEETVKVDLTEVRSRHDQAGIHRPHIDSSTYELCFRATLEELIEIFYAFDHRINTVTDSQYLQTISHKIWNQLSVYPRERLLVRLPGSMQLLLENSNDRKAKDNIDEDVQQLRCKIFENWIEKDGWLYPPKNELKHNWPILLEKSNYPNEYEIRLVFPKDKILQGYLFRTRTKNNDTVIQLQTSKGSLTEQVELKNVSVQVRQKPKAI